MHHGAPDRPAIRGGVPRTDHSPRRHRRVVQARAGDLAPG
jgi:hypothetical protein